MHEAPWRWGGKGGGGGGKGGGRVSSDSAAVHEV